MALSDKLSRQARCLWAKTGFGEESLLYSSLFVHMADSGEMARLLWREWLPESTRRLFRASMQVDDALCENIVTWFAMVHDIGKATPAFQCKNQTLADQVQEHGLVILPAMKHRNEKHSTMSEVILRRWLDEREWCRGGVDTSLDSDYSHTYSVVVGGHHGLPPSDGSIRKYGGIDADALGDATWKAVQDELLSFAWEYCGCKEGALLIPLSGALQMLVTGVVIMADWLASNTDYFPLVEDVSSKKEFEKRAACAWRKPDLPKAWRCAELPFDDGALFHARFANLPLDATLRPVQQVTAELARSATDPCMIIVEAPMGSGKTEASLLCAEILARKFSEGGLAYLLPTMATSNAMFARVASWLERVPDAEGADKRQSIRLAHSKAELNEDYVRHYAWGASSMDDGEGDGDSRASNMLACQWFGGSKKSLLASFVIGTVDQLLMAALQTKHIQLRHLGLAGKVVVVDEVHAYDVYMNAYLDRMLMWLGYYGVPIVLLSATLSSGRRNQLLRAYRGCTKGTCEGCGKTCKIPEAPRLLSGDAAYPLATRASACKDELPVFEACDAGQKKTDVAIEYLSDDEDALLVTLTEALQGGGCVCVLRDTVGRAQRTFSLLQEKLDCEVMLVHSRFIGPDRVANDAVLLSLLGPCSENRPHALVVVGTQVIEQSLDIDFDLLITDVAPVDLLLQRMGRLHRHRRGEGECERPPSLRRARCVIMGVEDWEAQPPVIAAGITSVYEKAVLWKSIACLKARIGGEQGSLVLPDDIAPLVEMVYDGDDEPIPSSWREDYAVAAEKLKKKRKGKQGNAKVFLLKKPPRFGNDIRDIWMTPVGADERTARASVRDTQESLEVVVVQEVKGELYLLPWVGDARVSTVLGNARTASLGDGFVAPKDETARIAAQCTVSVPLSLSVPRIIEEVIKALEVSHPVPGWQESRWLKGALPLVVDETFHATIACRSVMYELAYDRSVGLHIVDRRGRE